MKTWPNAGESGGFTLGLRLTWAVQRLILISAGVFVAQLLIHVPFGRATFSGVHLDSVTYWLAFDGQRLLRGEAWRLLTYIFLHANLSHLFMNMLWLFFFGPDVERALGTRQFFYFYLLCGAIGVLATLVPIWPLYSEANVLGASGAVMGVLMAFALLNPERELFLFPIPLPINARALVIIIVVLNLIGAVGSAGSSVGTHLGGMAAGWLYMKFKPKVWGWRLQARAAKKKSKHDPIGEAVDNIFKFEERKKRWPR